MPLGSVIEYYFYRNIIKRTIVISNNDDSPLLATPYGTTSFAVLTFSLYVNLTTFLNRVRGRNQVSGRLRYVDFHCFAGGLHTRCSVHRIAKQTVPGHFQSNNAGDHCSGVHADPNLQMRPFE